MTKAEAEAHVRSIGRTCRGPLVEGAADARNAALQAGDEEAAKLHDAKRVACGADFNDIILAGPLDGQQHPYTCPRCGMEGMYTAPLLECDAVDAIATS